MKKLLLLTVIFSAIITTTTQAQGDRDRSAMQKPSKETIKLQMAEKTGLTVEQAGKVMEINAEIRQEASTALAGLNEEDRATKVAELKATKEKRYSAIPLTAEQIKAVHTFFADMGKNAPPKGGK